MDYKPKEITENVNVSKKNPLAEAGKLIASLLGIFIAVYIVLGFAVDIIVPHLPYSIEESLGKGYKDFYEYDDDTLAQKLKPDQERVQAVLDGLTRQMPPSERTYTLHLVLSPIVNAVALPGGHILVYTGLLEELDTENELAFVLAHELGHFHNKDHLRGLGRGLTFFLLSATFFGQDNTLTSFMQKSLTNVEMKFSQNQESNADLFALDLVAKKYGHARGGVEFMEKMKKHEDLPKFAYLFATHPHPDTRISKLHQAISKRGLSHGQAIPLTPRFDYTKIMEEVGCDKEDSPPGPRE